MVWVIAYRPSLVKTYLCVPPPRLFVIVPPRCSLLPICPLRSFSCCWASDLSVPGPPSRSTSVTPSPCRTRTQNTSLGVWTLSRPVLRTIWVSNVSDHVHPASYIWSPALMLLCSRSFDGTISAVSTSSYVDSVYCANIRPFRNGLSGYIAVVQDDGVNTPFLCYLQNGGNVQTCGPGKSAQRFVVTNLAAPGTTSGRVSFSPVRRPSLLVPCLY